MITPAAVVLRGLTRRVGRLPVVVLVGGLVVMGALVAGCSGDDDDASPTSSGANLATATATSGGVTPGGTLVPAETPASSASGGSTGGATTQSPAAVNMVDMAPCSDQTYYELESLDDLNFLAYRNVPEGTPIFFPFAEGELRVTDAREGAILIVYDVAGVGTLTVQAAGSDALDRNVRHPEQGTVIGHFGRAFEEADTDLFVGYQMYAYVTSEATPIAQGSPSPSLTSSMLPVITDCLPLP